MRQGVELAVSKEGKKPARILSCFIASRAATAKESFRTGCALRVWISYRERRVVCGFSYRLPLNYIPVRSAFSARSSRASRAILFTLECALGVMAVVFVSALAHWFGGLLSVSVLLYLLIVAATALSCGFWQAVIVSLSAVLMQGYFTAHQLPSNIAINPANWVVLLAFVLVALVISRLAASVARHAREAEAWSEQVRDLYEFTRRTLVMNLHLEPGPQLAELVHEIFGLEAVAVFDAELHQVYSAGHWNADPRELAQNVYYFESSDDDAATGLGRRVVRLGTVPVGALVVEPDWLTRAAVVMHGVISSLVLYFVAMWRMSRRLQYRDTF